MGREPINHECQRTVGHLNLDMAMRRWPEKGKKRETTKWEQNERGEGSKIGEERGKEKGKGGEGLIYYINPILLFSLNH